LLKNKQTPLQKTSENTDGIEAGKLKTSYVRTNRPKSRKICIKNNIHTSRTLNVQPRLRFPELDANEHICNASFAYLKIQRQARFISKFHGGIIIIIQTNIALF